MSTPTARALAALSVVLALGGAAAASDEHPPEAEEEPDPLEMLLPALPRKVVAITLDDGPHPLFTPLLLEILSRSGAKATFFVVGQRVRQFPELARMIARQGSELANHTDSHPNLLSVPPDSVAAELSACNDAIRQVTGRRAAVFRPPGGRYDHHVVEIGQALGCPMVLWDVNTMDYRGLASEEIERTAVKKTRSGRIFLMHSGMIETVKALPHLLAHWRRRGYSCITVSELRALRQPTDRRSFERFYARLAVQADVEERLLWRLDGAGARPEDALALCRLARRSGRAAGDLVSAYLAGLSVPVIGRALGEAELR